MYIGHVGIALGAKGLRRDAPVWLLVIATQAPDWVDACTCAAGIEPTGMWSHSIAAVLALATGAWLATWATTRSMATSRVVAAIAVSHLLVDYLTGMKPTWPGGPVIGLGLYSHPVLEFALEVAVISVGWHLYRRSLPASASKSPARLLLVALLSVQILGDVKLALLPSTSKCQSQQATNVGRALSVAPVRRITTRYD